MGLVRIRGTIDLAQFWPDGQSDADTTKILLSVTNGSIEFATDGLHFKPTTVFDTARVRGTTSKTVITKGKVTIRLQGIDATELHYRAGPLPKKGSTVTDAQRTRFNTLNAHPRRQYWGETATVALANHLKPLAHNGQVECAALSAVDAPSDLIDTYGRIVANIAVGPQLVDDLNIWLTREGWVFPTFYSSMSNTEISVLLEAMKAGKKKHRVWRALSNDTSKFDSTLLFRGVGAAIDEQADKGPAIMPKMFRRQVAYHMQQSAGVFKGTFEKFLAQHPDECFTLKQFLAESVHSATTHHLDEFVKSSKFLVQPQELVFKEKPSMVVDAQGKRIDRFF